MPSACRRGRPTARARRHHRAQNTLFRWASQHVRPGSACWAIQDLSSSVSMIHVPATLPMPRRPIDAPTTVEILLKGQNRILEMVASARPIDSVLRSLCSLFERATPGSSASVIISDLSGSKVEMVVAPRLPKAFTKALAGRPVGREGDPSTTAIHRRTPVIVTDVERDPAWAASGWRELALKYGLRSSSSTPVLSPEGRSVGAFSVYWHEPRTCLEEHGKLIRQITHLASVVIERGRAAEALRSSDHLPGGSWRH